MDRKYFIDAAGQVRQVRRTFYKQWQETEGVPVFEGYSVEDVDQLTLGPWERKGGKGCFINLVGSEEINDFYLCEIPAGGQLKPQRHFYEEQVYILEGRGATTVWNEGGPKRTFEWQEGSLFSPPLNCRYQHFNGQGDKPARYIAMTMAPTVLNLFRDLDLVFKNDYVFRNRFDAAEDYFSTKTTPLGWEDNYARWNSVEDFLAGKEPARSNTLRTNFIADVRTVEVERMPGAGEGFASMHFKLSNNTVICHAAEFEVGKYKRAHRHGGGAHIILLNGKGYSLMWPTDKENEKMKIPWKKGTIIVPPAGWFHFHFPTSTSPTRYLALRGSFGAEGKYKTTLSVSKGGDCIDYREEDPGIRRIYAEELAKEGIKSNMAPSLYE